MSHQASTAVLPWRRRSDIVARGSGRGTWVLKDPVASRYFTFREEEYFVWSRLNGSAPMEKLCQAFADRFAPQQLSVAELQKFVAQLIAAGAGGCGENRRRRVDVQRRAASSIAQRLGGLNLLAIRFRGIDPDRVTRRAVAVVPRTVFHSGNRRRFARSLSPH